MYWMIVVYIGVAASYPNSGFEYPRTLLADKATCIKAAEHLKTETVSIVQSNRYGPTPPAGSIEILCVPAIDIRNFGK